MSDSTKSSYNRSKQPEQVIRSIHAAACELLIGSGFAGLSLNKVAALAGITKGGVTHHYPTKEALVSSVFEELRSSFEAALDQELQRFLGEPYSFSKAYSHAVLEANGESWKALLPMILAQPHLYQLWDDWLVKKQQRGFPHDCCEKSKLIRFAVDGMWLDKVLSVPEKRPEQYPIAAILELLSA